MKDLLIKNLQELKSSFGAVCVKAEFESEGAEYKDVQFLKELSDYAGLDFVLKIGGCEALRDLKDARKLAVRTIVAPMIESNYAFEKFVNAAKNVIPDAELLINIETINGLSALDDILNNPLSKALSGVTLGRSDFAGSLGIDDVEDKMIFNAVMAVSQKMYNCGKKFILGGCITSKTLQFIHEIKYLTQIETRKVVFAADKLDNYSIQKAIEFEINWLEFVGKTSYCIGDPQRLAQLKRRILNI